MNFIPPKIHLIIDFMVVLFLFAAPSLFDFAAFTVTFTYALAGVHLLLTILTDFGWGILKFISFPLHGVVELLVGVALIIMAFSVFKNDDNGHTFYIWFGSAVLVTWLFTNYDPKKPKHRAVR